MKTEWVKCVKKAQKGDLTAFSQCIKEYRDTMYRVALFKLRNWEQGQDAIQETALKAFQRIKTLRDPTLFKTWLIRILINECHTISRHDQHQQKTIVSMHERLDRDTTYSFTTNIEIREAIDHLQAEFRTVVVLFYFEDLTTKEIAHVLDIPVATVKTRLHRARKALQASFTEDDTQDTNRKGV